MSVIFLACNSSSKRILRVLLSGYHSSLVHKSTKNLQPSRAEGHVRGSGNWRRMDHSVCHDLFQSTMDAVCRNESKRLCQKSCTEGRDSCHRRQGVSSYSFSILCIVLVLLSSMFMDILTTLTCRLIGY